MSPNVVLLGLTAVLYIAGVYLLLERSLTRLLLGFVLLGNATNLLLLTSGGGSGKAPIVGQSDVADMADPLPQAMILTAIVITLGIVAFVLALIYRNWILDHQEDLVDDAEDVRIATKAEEANEDVDLAPGESGYDSGEDLDRDQPASERPA